MNELRFDSNVVHDYLKAVAQAKTCGLIVELYDPSSSAGQMFHPRFSVLDGDKQVLVTHDVRELVGFVNGWFKRAN